MKTALWITGAVLAVIGVSAYLYVTAQQEQQAQTEKEVEEIQETVGEDHEDIGEIVRTSHQFYNNTAGYGGLQSLEMDKQIDQAEENIEHVNEMDPDSASLEEDLGEIKSLSESVAANREIEDVRMLHRYFHDLDIALNYYDGNTKIWGVTETLEAG
ncbi:hypothetical protein [Sinobaca sp. H24]|uniref:hypothetical protein n=1 Tax=Sinobaca sp. H24 TaxID=2923376 RepID=UPI002079F491|nr:hypothetical protein [Sinobaca sp. H24]